MGCGQRSRTFSSSSFSRPSSRAIWYRTNASAASPSAYLAIWMNPPSQPRNSLPANSSLSDPPPPVWRGSSASRIDSIAGRKHRLAQVLGQLTLGIEHERRVASLRRGDRPWPKDRKRLAHADGRGHAYVAKDE